MENNELDLSGFDEEVQKELDLSGFDAPEESRSLMDRFASAPPIVAAPADFIADRISETRDAGLGAAQGLTMNLSDELVAGIRAPFGEGSLSESYESALAEERARYDQARERSPWLYGAGEIGAGVASAIATGGIGAGVKGAAVAANVAAGGVQLSRAAKLLSAAKTGAALGAAAGFGGSEGSIFKDPSLVTKDTLAGATLGGALGTAGEALTGSKAFESGLKWAKGKAEGNDWIKELLLSKKLGEEGYTLSPGSRSTDLRGGKTVPGYVTGETDALSGRILQADEELVNKIGDAFKKADELGIKVKFDEGTINKFNSVDDLASKLGFDIKKNAEVLAKQSAPAVDASVMGVQASGKTSSMVGSDLSPSIAKQYLNDLDATIKQVQTSANNDQTLNPLLNELYELRSSISDSLKNTKGGVPGYAEAASNLSRFRSNIQEKLLTGGLEDVSKVRYSRMPDREAKFSKKLGSVVEKFGTDSASAQEINALREMGEFLTAEGKNKGIGTKLKSLSDDFIPEVERVSTLHGTFTKGTTKSSLNPSASTAKGAVTEGLYGSGAKAMHIQANRWGAGTGAAGAVKNTVKRLYSMPHDSLSSLAEKVSTVPGIRKYGEALANGLKNKDKAKVNATLFIMAQSPDARQYVKELFGDDEQND